MILQSTINKEKQREHRHHLYIMRPTDPTPPHVSTNNNYPNQLHPVNPAKGLYGRYTICYSDPKQLLICDVFLYDYTN